MLVISCRFVSVQHGGPREYKNGANLPFTAFFVVKPLPKQINSTIFYMKIEQLLVQQLYNHKEVSLQGIGTFRLSESVVLPADGDKDFNIPADGISFTYDPKTTEDNALIDYIVQQTRKIKPLASADLDSYIMLSKQFLNIGKPLRIEGIGTLLKTQTGQYEYIPGQYITPKMEPATKPLKEKLEEDVSFRTADQSKPLNVKKLALVAGLVLLLGGGGFATWWYFTHKNESTTTTTEAEKPNPTKETATGPDTTKPVSVKPADSTLANTTTPANDGSTFKIVFKVTTNKAEAIERMNSLIKRGHKVLMSTADSVTYKLATPFTTPLSDTLRAKDSLGKFYHGMKNVFVETN